MKPNLIGIPSRIIADYAEFAAMLGATFDSVWPVDYLFVEFAIKRGRPC